MQLVLMVTARCNVRCSHCSTSCGPERTEHLSLDTVHSVIEQAAALAQPGHLQISITGGEPFLDINALREIIRFGTSRGAFMTCVSNGSWATSDERARATLNDLKSCGLQLLAISSSSFHEQFIKRQRVFRALSAARHVGMDCVLKFVQSADDKEVADIRDNAIQAGATRVEIIPLMPTVRSDAAIPDRQFARGSGIPTGQCPGAILNVSESGRTYTCCTPGAISDFFALGDVSNTPLHVIHQRFQLGAKQQILRKHGPVFFAKEIMASGAGHRLRSSYLNPCDLCTHIAGDPELAALATKAAGTYMERQIAAVLTLPGDRNAITGTSTSI